MAGPAGPGKIGWVMIGMGGKKAAQVSATRICARFQINTADLIRYCLAARHKDSWGQLTFFTI